MTIAEKIIASHIVSGDMKTGSEIALKIGADVPACLSDKAVFVSGIGENVEEVPAVPLTPVVLVNPNIALSTPAVFKNRKGDFDAPMRMSAADFAPEKRRKNHDL
mgnify:CR=1 FL=1